MATSKEKKTGKSVLNETSAKVGKALARSTHKVEATGQKIKKAAENLAKEARGTTRRIEETMEETMGKVKKEVGDLGKKRPSPEKAGAEPLLPPAKGMTVEGSIGFLAGDIYQHLAATGKTPVAKLIKTMEAGKNKLPMISAALGWLAREAKIGFSQDGSEIFVL